MVKSNYATLSFIQAQIYCIVSTKLHSVNTRSEPRASHPFSVTELLSFAKSRLKNTLTLHQSLKYMWVIESCRGDVVFRLIWKFMFVWCHLSSYLFFA